MQCDIFATFAESLNSRAETASWWEWEVQASAPAATYPTKSWIINFRTLKLWRTTGLTKTGNQTLKWFWWRRDQREVLLASWSKTTKSFMTWCLKIWIIFWIVDMCLVSRRHRTWRKSTSPPRRTARTSHSSRVHSICRINTSSQLKRIYTSCYAWAHWPLASKRRS